MSKIEVGQCYSYHDHVYMVIEVLKRGEYFAMQETLLKTIHCFPKSFVRELRRPFQNFG